MIAVAEDTWKSRVLHHGSLGLESEESWKVLAYNSYRAKLEDPRYPCFFGQTAEARGEMLYTFVSHHDEWVMLKNVEAFTTLIVTPEYSRVSLTTFFEPDSGMASHADFVERFWRALQFLHDHDEKKDTKTEPDHPRWEFAFRGQEMFVVGASPTYRKRKSRNLGPGMVLIFQPRHLFLDPATSQPIAAEVRHRIHKRMLTYDGMPVHPDIGFYGDLANREWKQYALPDDNEPETGLCPFHS